MEIDHSGEGSSAGGESAAAWFAPVEKMLRQEATTQTIFSGSQLICISGIETGRTWKPDIVAKNGRVGLFQFDSVNWASTLTGLAWNSGAGAKDPYNASLVALVLLTKKPGYSGVANPTAQAIENAIDSFGEHDGRYGKAVAECAKDIDSGMDDKGIDVLSQYAIWVQKGRP